MVDLKRLPPGHKSSYHPINTASTAKNNKYTIINKKLTESEKFTHCVKIFAVIIVFPLTLPAYCISSNVRKSINDLFHEIKTGTREVKVISEPTHTHNQTSAIPAGTLVN